MDLSRGIPPFRCNEIEKTKLHKEWQVWKRSLEYYFEAEDITDQKRKRAKLLHLGGPQIQALFQSLPNSEKFAVVSLEKAYYDVAIQAFDDFFQPGRQDVLERHNLRRMKQQEGERFAEFVIRIRQQISECGVDKYEPGICKILTDIMLTDTIVEGCASDELRKQILQKDRSVEEIEEIGKSLEGVQKQLKDFGSSREELKQHERVYGIHAKRRYQPLKPKTAGDFQPKAAGDFQARSKNPEIRCFKCGLFGHISTDTRCPARGKLCNRCKRTGHFEARCRMQLRTPFSRKEDAVEAKKIRVVERSAVHDQVVRESNAIEASDPSSNTPPKTYYTFYSGNDSNSVTCVIGGVSHPMLVDSGSEANLITDIAWEKFKSAGVEVISCAKGSDRVLKSYANNIPLTVLGTFKAVVRAGARSVEAEFFVIQGGQRSLLGDTTSKQLGILKVGLEIDQVSGSLEPLTKITGVCVHIHFDPNVKPVFQPMRRVPVALEEAVNSKLEELIARDIIEEKKGPVSWVSPLVVVGKANGEPRICLDLRRVNEAVLRERHPMPMIDDFLARLGPNMIRSKLDVKDSFLQLELDEASRDAMVFLTARGLYRFKRMPFGLVSAPEVFQKTMDAILAGCEGTWWYIDYVYIEGRDKEEHDERVAKVLARLKAWNVQLNWDKCIFGVAELEFLGHKITRTGIIPSDVKVEALVTFRRPENTNEVRSFLGLANYLNRFIPNLATVDAPLRELTRKGAVFKWLGKHEGAFKEIKAVLSDSSTLGFYQRGDRTLVMADASPIGLGGLLIQVDRQGRHRVISYASKSLTDTEKRYCHTEKEALALVWCVEKFYIYLYGIEFEILTDCKALIYLFTPRSRPCARIERWVLRLQGFDYAITHIPGDQNQADVLSRLSTLRPVPFDQREEIMIREIVDCASHAVAVPWEEIVEATKSDVEIQMILEFIDQDKRDELPTEFRIFANELCRVGDILLRGDRIVVPSALRPRILQIAHEGHLGTSMMKSTLRLSVWWPKMDKEVETFVRNCRGCILVSAPDVPEPMTRKQMPAGPWQEIAVDFLGPLPEGQWLFVVVDYYSRFVEVVEMRNITAADTIRELSTIFGRFGVPITMRADNGPQLSRECRELKQFCEELNIELVNTIPYWPQANGEVERQNRSILKRLRIAQELGKDWRLELRKFLLAYHSTIHSTTGKSPSELMFGRRIRNKLPSIPEYREDEEVRDRDKLIKEKGKEYSDSRRKARSNEIGEGDYVYAKRQRKEHKLVTDYSSELFKVIKRVGSEVTVKSCMSGNEYKRYVSHLKKAEVQAQETDRRSDEDEQSELAKGKENGSTENDSESLSEHLQQREYREEESTFDTGALVPEKRRRLAPKKFQDFVPF